MAKTQPFGPGNKASSILALHLFSFVKLFNLYDIQEPGYLHVRVFVHA